MDSYPDGYLHGDAHLDSHGNVYLYGDAYLDSYPDGYLHSNAYLDSHGNGYPYGDAHFHADKYAFSYHASQNLPAPGDEEVGASTAV
jgi:hypothetical protein